MTITPFEIAISDAAIADLKERLAMSRWPVAVDPGFDRGQPVTDVSIYWFTGGSAANIYLEDGRANGGDDARRNEVPTGAAVFPDDFRSVRAFSETNNNIVHWTQMPRGGHFAPVYESELLAADVAKFFRSL